MLRREATSGSRAESPHLAGVPHVPPLVVRGHARAVAAKRALDITVSMVALIVLSPFLILIGIAIGISSRGPVLFRQQRLGEDRRPFTMLKFRTMRNEIDDSAHRAYVRAMLMNDDLEASLSGLHKLRDERVTPIGRLLRRASLDELPQLVNVLIGDMSLVGPRPCLVWEADLFTDADATRFEVKPGITGLWQVSGRSRLTMRQALELDREYVNRQTLLLDVKILLKTIPVVLLARDAI